MLKNRHRLTGRPRAPGDAQRHGDEEKLVALLFRTSSDYTFGVDVVDQAQPQQGDAEVDAEIHPVPYRALVQHVPGDTGHIALAEPLQAGDVQPGPRVEVGDIPRRD